MSEPFSVKKTVQMEELLANESICKLIARNFEDLQKILLQTQLDVVNEGNRDTVGPTLLGLKHVQDVFFVFKTKGDVLINKENKETNA